MARGIIPDVNPAQIHLENIYMAMEHLTFCKDTAAWLVGGRKKLERLIAEGKIEFVKSKPTANSKWQCNAAQVLRYCRNMRQVKTRKLQKRS